MIGTRIAHYEIKRHLGSGGMGDVFEATDSKLGRNVAIKLLPVAFSHDSERVARFQREARVLASLSHANIAAIYGIEESDGKSFLVMELVQGETLAERIRRGPIPVDEATHIAAQVAQALEAAHEKGFTHRDLKPGNIMVTRKGNVKVLDFGLSKARGVDSAGGDHFLSETVTAVSMPGVILGTPAYMSPEQATGSDADQSSDVWSFGCVLYEMLVGQPVFRGKTQAEILAGVLRSEPDWNRLPVETPEGLQRLLRHCLQKDSRRRLRDMRDIRIEIEDTKSSTAAYQLPTTPRRARQVLLISSLVFVSMIAIVFVVTTFRSAQSSTEIRLDIATPPTTDPVSLAISPDGLKVVFVSMSNGRPALWLRSLDNGVSARVLKNTEGAAFPFWSPDSRSVGFFVPGKLKRIDLDGAIVKELANIPSGVGGSWNRGGSILYAGAVIYKLPETGGEPVPVTQLGERQTTHKFPQFLPDGAHFLFYVSGAAETRGVYVGNANGSKPRRLLDADAAAAYGSGRLLFVQQQTLFAQPFDPDSLTLSGVPSVVAEPITVSEFLNIAALSASAAGPFVYRGGDASRDVRQFQWLDSSGAGVGKVGEADTKNPINPAMSPDFLQVAVARKVDGNNDIWLLDLENGRYHRLTTDTSIDTQPVFSPDGAHLLFNSNRNGTFNFYRRTVSGAGKEQVVFETAQTKGLLDWSRDWIVLYRVIDRRGGYDLFAFQSDASGKTGSPFPVVATDADESDGQFSPDGKWIAYQSDESKQVEVYIQQFPSGIKLGPLSVDGGAQARWRTDGKELFYIALDGRLMAVPIRFAPDGTIVKPGAPRPLFMTRIGGALQANNRQQYMVSKDGRYFLMNTLEELVVPPITIVLNSARTED